MFSLSKPTSKPKFEKPTWPKLPNINTEEPRKTEVEKLREELPANVEGTKEFNEVNNDFSRSGHPTSVLKTFP